MRILCIEDEAGIARVLARGLTRAGFTVEIAADGESGLQRACEEEWALIVLDWMLPGRDGLEVCRVLRARRSRTPILMLTARDAVPDRIRGLETGADDYLPKPFVFEELLARVRALLRRENVHRTNWIELDDLRIDLTHKILTRGETEIPLTPREWSLMETLVANEGRPVSRETILTRIWGEDARIGSNAIDVYINQLRRKLGADEGIKLIHTVHGIGYVLRRPERR